MNPEQLKIEAVKLATAALGESSEGSRIILLAKEIYEWLKT